MKNGINLALLGIANAQTALQPGMVGIANEGAFANTFLSEALTDFAINWTSENGRLEELLDFLAPGMRTPRRFEYRVGNNNDQFALVANDGDVRATYGEFQLVKSVGQIVNSKTVSKGLTTVIEKDEEVDGLREQKVAWLKSMLMRAEIYRAVSLMNAAATNTAKTWGSSATPDVDLLAAVDAFGDATGVDANRILFGSTAWQKRIGAYNAQGFKNFAPSATMDGLADFLGIDAVRKSSERYAIGSTKNKLMTNNLVFVFRGTDAMGGDDTSSMKRFWTPEVGGGEYVVYIDEITNPALVRITVAHKSQVATTVSTGIQKLTIS